MAPIIEVSNKVLEGLDRFGVEYKLRQEVEPTQNKRSSTANFIYIKPANLYFANQRTHLGKNWFDTHKLLSLEKLTLPNGKQSQLRMPTLPEFVAK